MKIFIGDKIREYRHKSCLTQSELGAKLHVDARTISSWEKNRTEPKQAQIQQLCKIFDCSDYDLTGLGSYEIQVPEFNAIIELYNSLNAEQKNRALLYMLELKMEK